MAVDEPAPTRLAPDKLGVLAIAFFVVAAAAPMAAVVGASPVLFSATGPGTPVIYALAALLIALFAVGYLRMSHHITNAGGFVAYIAKGLGNVWATGGAGLALLTYLALQVGLWSQFGVFAQGLVAQLSGIDIPPLAWILTVFAAVTMLTMRGVDASLKLLGVLIVGEAAVVAILVVVLIVDHGFGVFSIAGFTADNVFGPGLGIALLFALLCFTSFEATVVFSEEARDPRRTIPRALYLVIAFVGVFYTLSTWVIGGAVGIGSIQQTATADPAGFIFGLAEDNGGHALSLAMQILVVTSFVAMLLGLCNMFARYLFALGRAGVLPRGLAAVSRRGSPGTAALVNSATVAVVISAFLLGGADPITVVFAWFSALGSASFIAILLLTSVAVVAFFLRHRLVDDVWQTVVAPVLSIAAFAYAGYVTLTNYTVLTGSGGTAQWLLVLIPAVLLAGMVRGLGKRSIDYSAQVF
ncbi:APC family permease [Geodermatophilus sp. SYSU D01186]